VGIPSQKRCSPLKKGVARCEDPGLSADPWWSRSSSRPDARLPPNGTLCQGDAHAPGLGRAALCRSEPVAWPAVLPLAWVGASQRRGAVHRAWSEPEATPELARVGRPPSPSEAAESVLPAFPLLPTLSP